MLFVVVFVGWCCFVVVVVVVVLWFCVVVVVVWRCLWSKISSAEVPICKI